MIEELELKLLSMLDVLDGMPASAGKQQLTSIIADIGLTLETA